MQTTSSKLFHAAGLLTAASLALTSAKLIAADNPDAFPVFDSYIKITGQAASIKGDSSAFQSRTGISEFKDGTGIEDARYVRDLNKTTTMTLEGHALSGSEDYLLHLNLLKSEVGSVDVGYKSFRTFYDGVGGFFPHSPWTPVNQVTNKDGKAAYPGVNQNMFVDRGEFWAEIKIGLPDQPEFKLRYTNGTRIGQKDSTSWGDSDNTGLPYTNGTFPVTNAADRKTIPSYLDISERHEALEGSVKHTVGDTTGEITLLGDWTSKNNGRFEDRYPGEVKNPNAAGTGTVNTADWTTFNNETQLTNYDIQDTTTTGVNGTTITTLGPKLTMRLGAGYQSVSSAFGGSRTQVAYAPVTVIPGGALRQLTTFPVQNLNGQSDSDIRTGKIAFDYKLFENFTVSIGTRGEDTNSGSNGTYDVVTKTTTATPNTSTTNKAESSTLAEQSVTPVLDLRYTGIRNLALYSSVTHKSGTGTEDLTPAYTTGGTLLNGTTLVTTPIAAATPTIYHNDISENNTDYTIGGNWRVSSAVTLRAEPFYKNHDFHSRGFNRTGAGPRTQNNYELQSQFYGAKFTAIVKPISVLSFTSRYTYQKGKMQVTGNLVAPIVQAENDSMDSTTQTISETIDWNPVEQFYMQGNATVVFNQISTVSNNPNLYDTAVGAIPGNYLVQNSNNSYLTFSVLAGAVITKRDDLQVQFIAYRAANSTNQLAPYTQPYGSSGYENSVTVGLIHKFSAKMMGQAKVGYFNSHDQTTGGNTDFEGPLAYVSLSYGL